MIRVLAVCTGNICRSPLAEKVLGHRLSDVAVSVSSAGTRARDGTPMTPQAIALAAARGVPEVSAGTHAARLLTAEDVLNADLVLALARSHRREVVELAPRGLRTTFTVREFARLSSEVDDDEIRAAAEGPSGSAEDDPQARVAAAIALIARQRGILIPPSSPEEDDVVDPFGRSPAIYARSGEQLDPGLHAVERVLRLALR